MEFSSLGHFLRANDSKIEPDGRGAYWGDVSRFITSQSIVEKFCDNPLKNVIFTSQYDKDCKIFTNKNGVKIVQHRTPEYCMEEGCKTTPATNQFHFYNPYSNFNGVSLSLATINSKSRIDDLETFENVFYELVNSINFVK